MGGHAYLKFQVSEGSEAGIPGDSQTAGFEDWIVISSFTWEVALNENNSAKPSVFRITKLPCKASTQLMTALATGKRYPKLTVQILDHAKLLKRSEGQQVSLELKDVRAIEYSVSVSEEKSSVKMEEDWQFDYSSVKFAFNSSSNSAIIPNSGPPSHVQSQKEKDEAKKKAEAEARGGGRTAAQRNALSLSNDDDDAPDDGGSATATRRSGR